MMRSSVLAGVFLMVIGIGGYLAIRPWMATRIFVPVDMPVSLKRGHIRTGPFLINLKATYSIWLDWDWTQPRSPNCDVALETRWVLSRGGQVMARWDPGEYPEFSVGSGIYDLDLEVLKDARCLDFAHPRLQIRTHAGAYAGYVSTLLWLSLICTGAGASLVVIAARERFRRAPAAATGLIYAGTSGGRYRLVPRVARRRIPSGLPSFGLVAGNTYMLLAVTVWVFQSLFHLPPQGFSVHLLRPELRSQAVSGIQPLYVRLEFRGVNHRPGLSVDSQPVAWEDFGNVLQNGLRSRPPSWPVYVEADRDVEWESAVKAVDVIRGLNAEVTLLTGRR
jgi:hypothetical protein